MTLANQHARNAFQNLVKVYADQRQGLTPRAHLPENLSLQKRILEV